MTKCCCCGREFNGPGHNPEPAEKSFKGRCCDSCNIKIVIPERIKFLVENEEK